ncbi:MAG: tetratricopeptide repeat protein [Deltaproteobacteria bacterium]|nr:tetratricopeptide repeat protein [Deltaproteobacteria bacterium]
MNMTTRMGGALAILLLAVTIAPAHAWAQDDDQAFELYKKGVDLAKVGEYEEAIKHFEEARMRGAPDQTLFNLGKCYEGLGLFHVAVDYYDQYLESPNAKHVDAVKDVVEELRIKPSKLVFTSEPQGAEVRQVLEDGTEVKLGVTPFEHTAEAGEFTFIVTKEGLGEKKVTLEAGYGKPYDLEIDLTADDVEVDVIDKSKTLDDLGAKEPEPEPEPEPPRPKPVFPKLGLAIELGAGAALFPHAEVDFQAGGIFTFGAAYRFSLGVKSGLSAGLRFTFRSYELTGSQGGDDRTWKAFMIHILAVPGYQIEVHEKLGLDLTLPLGIVILNPTDNLSDSAWIDLVDGRISGGNVALFDLGVGAALRIKLVSGLYVTVEPVRLHILFPFKSWGNGTKALFDLDITARIGFQF